MARSFKFRALVVLGLVLTGAGPVAAQEWDEAIVKQKMLEMAVTQCLQEVVFPQNYTSTSGDEEMEACLERKGVVTVEGSDSERTEQAGGYYYAPSRPAAAESDSPYEIPDVDRLARTLEEGGNPAAEQTAEKADLPVQDTPQEAAEPSHGELYVPSSKRSSGEGKARPVFLNR